MQATWHRALSLSERAELEISPGEFSEEELNLGEERLSRWRSETNLATEPLFEVRRGALGLSREDWVSLLAEPDERLRDRLATTPPWAERVTRAYRSERPPLISRELERSPFLNWVEPLVRAAHLRLVEQLTEIGSAVFPARIADLMVDPMLAELEHLIHRTLILELNVAKHLGQLDGESADERFASFMARLRDPGRALEIAHSYPILARAIDLRLEQWIAVSVELATRLTEDLGTIEARFFGGGTVGPVESIDFGLGDRHQHGHTVSRITFESGFNLIYKPRPVAIEAEFSRLVDWLMSRQPDLDLKTLSVIDRGEYGWTEFLEPAACHNLEEIGRFYRRMGCWIGLMYVLEATDFHHENIFACGEHPLLIDLETLFQPLVGAETPTADQPREAVGNVLRSGLLPRRFWAQEAAAGVDLSGMGSTAPPVEIEQILDPNSESARFEKQMVFPEAKKNRPTLKGEPVELHPFEDDVVAGFQTMYELLESHRETLLADDGPLAPFANAPVRVIIRTTDVYARLLRASFHPDFLQSGLARDRLFDKLWLDAGEIPEFRSTVAHEIQALKRTEVPRFTTFSDSRSLWTDGGVELPDYFERSAWELVAERIASLGKRDLARQTWLVRGSIQATLREIRSQLPSLPAPDRQPAASPTTATFDRNATLEAAQLIAARIDELAFESEDWVSWFHVAPNRDSLWNLAAVGTDVYTGLPGIALFLAQAGRLLDNKRYSRLAELAISTSRRTFEVKPEQSIGAFEGWGGWLYTLTYLGKLWDQTDLLDEAEAVLPLIREGVAGDLRFDIIGGAAGALAAVLELSRHRPSSAADSTLAELASHLVSNAKSGSEGIYWQPPAADSPTPLTGFAHGTSGIAWALHRWSERHHDSRIREVVAGALEYERASYCEAEGSWPDLRFDNAEERAAGRRQFPAAWCHGAPGIGLARLSMSLTATDPNEREQRTTEMVRACQATLERGFEGGDGLCHGTLGNLDFVLQAAQALEQMATRERSSDSEARSSDSEAHSSDSEARMSDLKARSSEFRSRANPIGAAAVERACNEASRSDQNLSLDQPGLMVGLSGVGYGLLRLASPEEVPSLLTLETPGPPS